MGNTAQDNWPLETMWWLGVGRGQFLGGAPHLRYLPSGHGGLGSLGGTSLSIGDSTNRIEPGGWF